MTEARATVLAYHAVGPCPVADDPCNLWVDADAFARQMADLARRRRVVPLEDVVEDRVGPGRPAVAITFDDAYRCVLEHALPVLEHHGFPATVFLPTAFVGDRNRWDPPQPCDLSIVTADEVRDLVRRGIAVESHGHRHLDLRDTDEHTTREDLTTSRDVLTELLGHPPRHLAWPYRDGSDRARTVAAELGFRTAFSIDLPHTGPYGFGRVQVTPLDSDLVFRAKTSGRWLQLRHHRAVQATWSRVRRLVPERGARR